MKIKIVLVLIISILFSVSLSTFTSFAAESLKNINPAKKYFTSMDGSFSFVIQNDDKIVAWGYNDYGQLGDGTTNYGITPKEILFPTRIETISIGLNHVVAIDKDGYLWSWGDNNFGQVGKDLPKTVNKPIKIEIGKVIDAKAGADFTIAVKEDGTVWSWGNNKFGQLGYKTVGNVLIPTKVNGLENVKKVAAGKGHTLALTSDGIIWAWGNNEDGQLGNGTKNDRFTPIIVNNLNDIIDIACGSNSSIALKKDGTVYNWGYCGGINVTPKRVEIDKVQAISAKYLCAAALREDGTVWAWGERFFDLSLYSKPVQFNNINSVKFIEAGFRNIYAVCNDGKIYKSESSAIDFNPLLYNDTLKNMSVYILYMFIITILSIILGYKINTLNYKTKIVKIFTNISILLIYLLLLLKSDIGTELIARIAYPNYVFEFDEYCLYELFFVSLFGILISSILYKLKKYSKESLNLAFYINISVFLAYVGRVMFFSAYVK